ncbi:MAG: hypothetical protein WCQ99_08175 [Pseudomonadota bacterium]
MSGTTDFTEPSGKTDSENALHGTHPSGRMETAGRRVLLYLKALHVPVRKRYEIAGKALCRAEKSCPAGGDLVAEAMRSLHELLKESRLPAGESSQEKAPEGDGAPMVKDISLADIFAQELGYVHDMPKLNRGHMIPVELERTGAITFFSLLFIKLLFFPLRSPLRVYFLFFTFLALAMLYWWRSLNQ